MIEFAKIKCGRYSTPIGEVVVGVRKGCPFIRFVPPKSTSAVEVAYNAEGVFEAFTHISSTNTEHLRGMDV